MDINCGMELHFAETSNLEDNDFVSSGASLSETANLEENDFVSSSTELSDKLNLGTNTEAVHHLLVLDQVSPPSRSCTDHDTNDKHLSAADFKLDLGPANDLVSAADFPIENSVTDITSDGTTEENSEGYSILNAALEGNPDLKQQATPSRANINTIPTLPLTSILPNLQAVQVVPIGNLQQLQLLTSARPTTSDSTVAQLLSANQKNGQFLQQGSQQTNNSKIIPLNLVQQQGTNQVLGVSSSGGQKLPVSSNQCSTDATKTVQELINLQSGSSSAFLLGNLLVLQPVTNQLQGNTPLTQSSVNTLSTGNSLYANNTLQPSCAASSNLTTSDHLLKKIVPQPNLLTAITSTSFPVQSSTSTATGRAVSQTLTDSLLSVSNTGSSQEIHSAKADGRKDKETGIAVNSEEGNQENDSLKLAGRKNTKIVIYGKTISMTFDCRNKSGLGTSTSLGNKPLDHKNVSGDANTQPCTAKAPIVCPTSSDHASEFSPTTPVQNSSSGDSSQVKYVSILEPNISSKLRGKTNNVQTTSLTSVPMQVQNKLDVSKVMQLNPIKVNLGSSFTSSQGQDTSKSFTSVPVAQNSQNIEEAVKVIPHVELEQLKETSNLDESTPVVAQGGTRHEYRCDLCSASFNRYGNYTRHRMIHTVNTKDDYRYKCQECGRLFLQRCDMKRHMLIHTNEQPFRCNECGRGYIRRSDLVVHMRFHKKEKTFKCVYCSKNFYQSGDLNRHMRNIHLQTSMLTCGHCSRQFVKEATLIRHMQTRHRDIIIRTLKTSVTTPNSENDQDDSSTTPSKDPSLKTEDIEMMEDVVQNGTEDRVEDKVEDKVEEDTMVKLEQPSTDMDTSSGIIQIKGQLVTNQTSD
ncbi:uncharacterized protein [Argopecten irradians]|uniref:uncharacterized protein n=1 Tax=Argopecten irradians TaxID=31199 RepID=UPI00371109B8